MIGVFSTFDGLLFYVFFEATLIPMFVIIGVWGGERRVYAAFKFFLYTFFGSLPMLIGILYLYLQTNSFNIFTWYNAPIPLNVQIWLFIAFLTAFAVKVRCGRCIPGCPMPTSRHRQEGQSFWLH